MEYAHDSAAAQRGWREAGGTTIAAFSDLTALAVLAAAIDECVFRTILR